MCRLFGFRSQEVVSVHQSLIAEQNSLLVQSTEHQHGWGIAYYEGDQPTVSHGVSPAHADANFDRLSRLVASKTVLAHVRRASVGEVRRCNVHPFVHGKWSFAHNGTVQGFAASQGAFESLIDPKYRMLLRGQTDSERCFYLFLTQLDRFGHGASPSLNAVAEAVARTMQRVASLDQGRGPEASSLNFIATDGQRMVASRRGRSLFSASAPRRNLAQASGSPS
jgi:glutamine amidotransferase